MPLLNKKRRLVVTGGALILAVIITRLPFLSQTLFEFDSVAFAVATFRFSLQEVTPHMPGYILHILLGRFFLFFTSDHNTAYVLLSIVLSVGSTLFMWRAASYLRGERVGVVTALLWLTLPMFWLYGEVATVYIHDAFFASAILYFGLKLHRKQKDDTSLVLLLISWSLAAAARQSDFLFFAPAVIYILVSTRQSLQAVVKGLTAFVVIASAWVFILIDESGGLSTYLEAMNKEHLYRSQSILFGNPFNEHFAVVKKILLYFLVGSLPLLLIAVSAFLFFSKDTYTFIKSCLKKRSFIFVSLVAAPSLLFYITVYFMKAGYLLTVLPSLVICGAVLLDMLAIWFAKRRKERHPNVTILTRRLITKNTTIAVSAVMMFNVVWFVLPLPGRDFATFCDHYTRQSYLYELTKLYRSSKVEEFMNRVSAYTSVQGIQAIDSINQSVSAMLQREISDVRCAVIFDTWHQRHNYYYIPDAIVYNIRAGGEEKMWYRSRQHQFTNTVIDSTVIVPPNIKDVLLFIREDHPDMKSIASQVQLQKIEMPDYLGVYRIVDDHFTLMWEDLCITK